MSALLPTLALLVATSSPVAVPASIVTEPKQVPYAINDVHLHLTNYVQEGPEIRALLQMMKQTIGRAAVFGIPLQQQWSSRIDGEDPLAAPKYYLRSDAHTYYYSFTDAFIAVAYRSLPSADQARFDPMITGFNPADMYAADHIKRVLRTFPGVFSGIGEFSIHKEFVSDSVAGDVASLEDPALDRIFSTAEEVGLIVLIHNDIDTPFSDPAEPPAYLAQMRALLRRHTGATVIWAHTGLGRIIAPRSDHLARLRELLEDPKLGNLNFDLSWSVVAEHLVGNEGLLKDTAALINAYPDRFLYGSDALAPRSAKDLFATYQIYDPLWARLSERARRQVLKANYERLFDGARRRVRAWEKAHPREDGQ